MNQLKKLYRGGHPWRRVLLGALIVQAVVINAVVFWASLSREQKISTELFRQMRGKSTVAQDYLENHLKAPYEVNEITAAAWRFGSLALQAKSFDQVSRFFEQQIKIYNVDLISFRAPQGGFVGIERINNSIERISPQKLGFPHNNLPISPQRQRTPPLVDQRAWYTDAVKIGKPSWNTMRAWHNTPVISIGASYPLYDGQGQLVGVLGSSVMLSEIGKALQKARVSPNSEVFIIDRHGFLVGSSTLAPAFTEELQRIHSSQSQDSLIRGAAKLVFNRLAKLPNNNKESIEITGKFGNFMENNSEFHHIRVSYFSDKVYQGIDWLIVVVVPESDFTVKGNASTLAIRTTMLGIVTIVLAIITVNLSSRFSSQPIQSLNKAVQSLAQGNLTPPSHLELNKRILPITELKELSDAFQIMAKQLSLSITAMEESKEDLKNGVDQRTKALKLSEEKFAAAFSGSPNPIALIKLPEGIFVEVNEAFQVICGCLPIAVIGKTIREVRLIPDRRDQIKIFRLLLKQGELQDFELEYQNYYGKRGIVLLSVQTTDFGSNVYLLAVARDITERKRVESALLERERKLYRQNYILLALNRNKKFISGDLQASFALITESITLALSVDRASIWLFDDSQKCLICQDLYILATHSHSKGLTLETSNHPKYFQLLESEGQLIVNDVLVDQRSFELLGSSLKPLGIGAMLDTRIRLGMAMVGVLCLESTKVYDWTVEEQSFARSSADLVTLALETAQRSQAAIELANARDAADAANRAKSEFLSNMSHELRTPLNGILGYAQILQRSAGLPPHASKGVQTILNSGNHLLTLINDILDLSKIEARKMELYPTPVHLITFLASVIELSRIRSEQKNLQFVVDLPPDLPEGVIVDEKRLRQVLLNLLGNAIKFTDRGQVAFRVRYNEKTLTETPSTAITFTIEDTGVGISPSQISQLFQAFQQVGNSAHQAEGTGLGLSISQKLVHLMGGEIQVESTYEIGSKFWFTLTMPITTNVTSVNSINNYDITDYIGKRRTILIVDDKENNRDVLRGLLIPIGFYLIEATNGQEGIQKAKEKSPDLIITDLVMPVLDGFAMVQQLRQINRFQHIPIIASSASVFQSDQDRCRQIGCNSFVAKPIQAEELLNQIAQLLHLEWEYATLAQLAPFPAPILATPVLTVPPIAIIQELVDLTQKGSFKKIQKRLKHLEKHEKHLTSFVQAIRPLAETFQEKALLDFLQQSLGKNHV